MKLKLSHILAGFAVLATAVILLFPKVDITYQAQIPRLGEISSRGYTSPISFEVPKSKEDLQTEQAQAESKVLAVFEFNHERTRKVEEEFDQTMQMIGYYGSLKTKASMATPEEAGAYNQEASVLFTRISRRLSGTAINQLSQHSSARDSLSSVFHRIMREGVSEILLAATPRQVTLYREFHNKQDLKHLLYTHPTISLVRNNHESDVDISKIRPREAVIEDAFASIQFTSIQSQGLQSAFYEALYAFVIPNIFYLEKETQRRKKIAADEVNPIKGMVVKGMEILPAGSIVTQDAIDKLKALEIALESQDSKRSILSSGFGQFLMLLVCTLLFIGWLSWFHRKQIRRLSHFWALITIHVFQVALFALIHWLAQQFNDPGGFLPHDADLLWMQPFLMAPVLATVLFNYRVGLVSVAFCAIHMGMQSGQDLALALVIFFVGSTAIAFLHQIRYRYHFIFSSLIGILALTLGLLMLLLLRNRLSWDAFWPPLLLSSISLVTSVSIGSLFLIHLFERIFSITTNLSLIELSDFNHPALKRLSENAPGSFHHSIMVGNLAEKAATRIKANALLTRVMALYHDIGKSENPRFFTENQKVGENAHDTLSPWESVRIIREHVSQGLDMAREFKIPDLVSAGIPEHHGDNVIHYFYRKAVKENPDKEISPDDFRYAGPRPQSRESAILMMADSIEATSRSMDEPDSAKLSKLVRDVVQTRLHENQLGESGLTLRDLFEIEIGFLQSLEGMYHTRIQYPDGAFISSQRAS